MLILLALGIGLYLYGRRMRLSSMYPTGERWPLRSVLASLPKWDQSRVVYALGGATLQFAGVIVVIGSNPLF